MWLLKQISGIFWVDHLSNQRVFEETHNTMKQQQASCPGHEELKRIWTCSTVYLRSPDRIRVATCTTFFNSFNTQPFLIVNNNQTKSMF